MASLNQYTSGGHYNHFPPPPPPPLRVQHAQSHYDHRNRGPPPITTYNHNPYSRSHEQHAHSPVTPYQPPTERNPRIRYQRTDSQYTTLSSEHEMSDNSKVYIKTEPYPDTKMEPEPLEETKPSIHTQISPHNQRPVAYANATSCQKSPTLALSPQQDVKYMSDEPAYMSPIVEKATTAPAGLTQALVPAVQSTSQIQPQNDEAAMRHTQLFGYHPPQQGISSAEATALARTPMQSSLPSSYSTMWELENESNDSSGNANAQESGELSLSQVRRISERNVVMHQFLGYYLTDVLSRQYIFADQVTIQRFLWDLADTSTPTKDAMCLLSSLHMQAMWQLADAGIGDAIPDNVLTRPSAASFDWGRANNFFHSRVRDALGITYGDVRSGKGEPYTEGDAMAGLHLVSAFLFSGGRGQWPYYLEVAMQWVESRLANCSDESEILVNANEMQRFITRTTFWFDVWGSITQRRQPRFMDVYRRLFGGSIGAFIGEAPNNSRGPISMVNIIGCSNFSFRAMAEIATLASWKDEKANSGSLSIQQLVGRATEIESKWLAGEPEEVTTPPIGLTEQQNQINFQRQIASDVFKASARVYLHMVISSALPRAPEIKKGVQDVITLLQQIPHEDVVSTTAIVRSVISAICICGCLAEDENQMDFFIRRLDSLGAEAELFGNCRTVKLLIRRVWNLRMQQQELITPVDWREVLMEGTNDVVLLV